ncbi:MAG: alpha/beta fold hydrolase [Gemmatimonadaceae bacterium]|nr:alpha/beta fold hydrolase [Gemmatimonadaceae bacterium]
MTAVGPVFASFRRAVLATAAVVVAFSTACARHATLVPVPSAARADTIWYVSARARADGRDTRELTDTLEYGYVVYASERVNDALDGALDVALIDSVRLTEPAFTAAIQPPANDEQSPDDFTVLYVHGFGTSLHEGWQYAAEARIRSRASARWVVFCWPSNGVGVTWPRIGELFSRAYHEDTEVALSSRPAFMHVAHMVIDAIGATGVVLVSHSLGGRIVSDALTTEFGLASILNGATLQTIAFVAPDVDARHFGDSVVPAARRLAQRVVLYTSGRDRVLSMSRQINGADRAGQPNATPLIRPGLETVDMTDGFVAEGWFQGIFGTHHAIRRASAALFDLMHVVGAGFAPSCRTTLETATRTDAGVWRLTSTRPPDITARRQCERDLPAR